MASSPPPSSDGWGGLPPLPRARQHLFRSAGNRGRLAHRAPAPSRMAKTGRRRLPLAIQGARQASSAGADDAEVRPPRFFRFRLDGSDPSGVADALSIDPSRPRQTRRNVALALGSRPGSTTQPPIGTRDTAGGNQTIATRSSGHQSTHAQRSAAPQRSDRKAGTMPIPGMVGLSAVGSPAGSAWDRSTRRPPALTGPDLEPTVSAAPVPKQATIAEAIQRVGHQPAQELIANPEPPEQPSRASHRPPDNISPVLHQSPPAQRSRIGELNRTESNASAQSMSREPDDGFPHGVGPGTAARAVVRGYAAVRSESIPPSVPSLDSVLPHVGKAATTDRAEAMRQTKTQPTLLSRMLAARSGLQTNRAAGTAGRRRANRSTERGFGPLDTGTPSAGGGASRTPRSTGADWRIHLPSNQQSRSASGAPGSRTDLPRIGSLHRRPSHPAEVVPGVVARMLDGRSTRARATARIGVAGQTESVIPSPHSDLPWRSEAVGQGARRLNMPGDRELPPGSRVKHSAVSPLPRLRFTHSLDSVARSIRWNSAAASSLVGSRRGRASVSPNDPEATRASMRYGKIAPTAQHSSFSNGGQDSPTARPRFRAPKAISDGLLRVSSLAPGSTSVRRRPARSTEAADVSKLTGSAQQGTRVDQHRLDRSKPGGAEEGGPHHGHPVIDGLFRQPEPTQRHPATRTKASAGSRHHTTQRSALQVTQRPASLRPRAVPVSSTHRKFSDRSTAPAGEPAQSTAPTAPVRPAVVPRSIESSALTRQSSRQETSEPGRPPSRSSAAPVQRRVDRLRKAPGTTVQRSSIDPTEWDEELTGGVDTTEASHSKKAKVAKSTSRKLTELDELIDSIEERVLAQLERRGGRYQGSF